MTQPPLSDDSRVLLLLTSHLGCAANETDSGNGLGPVGWHDFEAQLRDSALKSPADLLHSQTTDWPEDIWTAQATRDWVAQRLGRLDALETALADLTDREIWVTTFYESTYPDQLRAALGRKAPPFFYVAGEAAHLQTPAVGFVGSRDADATDKQYTRRLVATVMEDGFGVVSGGAKGIDMTAEDAGIEHGGPVIEFPVKGLNPCLAQATTREAIANGKLTLVSYYHPDASWNTGAAMGRNKFIHGFADYTVVIRSGDGTGGTWAGATENLKHQWSPLLVCDHEAAPPGNHALLEKGGIPINPTALPEEDSFENWIQTQQQQADTLTGDESTDGRTDEDNEETNHQSSLDQF